MTYIIRHSIFWILLGMLLPVGSCFAQSEFRATADRTEVAMDGTVRLTYTFENVEAEDFNPPDFSPFEAYGPNQSRNMSWVNGKVSQSMTYTYTLKPTKEGEFEIPAATARIKGKLKKCNPINLRVVASGTTSPGNNNSGNNQPYGQNSELHHQIRDNLFIRVIPSKTSAYEGEQITLTYKLYYNLSLDDLSILKMPMFDGFLSHEIELSESQRHPKNETYNGRQYNSQTIHQIAVFPSRSGSYTIEPMKLQAIVLLRKNDPGFFFPRTERIRHEFKSSAITLNINPLPTKGRPSTFTGAVGQYDFVASYDRTETQVDDPITLKIKISGKGNIKLIDLPDFQFPQSFEVYNPKIKESISKKSYTVNGSKAFEYLIIPRGGGSFQMPDISFSYFDIQRETYITRTQDGPLVTVEGTAMDPRNYTGTGLNKEEVALLGDDIRYLKTGKMISANDSGNIITKPLFQALAWLPVFLALFLPIIYSRRKRIRGDAVLMKSKKAHKEASRRMNAARKLMHSGDDKAFYNEVVKSVWGYLGDKFDLPNTELSRENSRTVLSGHGISANLVEEITRLIDICEMAIYAPMAIRESKDDIIKKVSELIGELEKEIQVK